MRVLLASKQVNILKYLDEMNVRVVHCTTETQFNKYVTSAVFDVVLIGNDVIQNIYVAATKCSARHRHVILLVNDISLIDDNKYIEDFILYPTSAQMVYKKLLLITNKTIHFHLGSLIQEQVTRLCMQITNEDIWNGAYKYLHRIQLLAQTIGINGVNKFMRQFIYNNKQVNINGDPSDDVLKAVLLLIICHEIHGQEYQIEVVHNEIYTNISMIHQYRGLFENIIINDTLDRYTSQLQQY